MDAFGSVLLQTPMWRHEGDSTDVIVRRRGFPNRIGPEAAQSNRGRLAARVSSCLCWWQRGKRRLRVDDGMLLSNRQPTADSVGAGEELSAPPPLSTANRIGDPKGVYSAPIKTSGVTKVRTGAAADTVVRAKHGDSRAPRHDRPGPARSPLHRVG